MATVDALTGSQSGGSSVSSFSGMSSDDFMKIVLSELSKQDPLKPNDTSALIEQISQIRSIQSDIDLSSTLKSLVKDDQFSTAAGLIGTNISGLTDANLRVTGIVTTVSRTDAGAVLTLLSGERVPMSKVDEISVFAGEDNGNSQG
ncbi:MAG: flagellar biosynthesis protein FlgD [Phycisphaerales bacterium]|jgi:flagellar basal-body rod modification protein FlgD|nr:flagellar biosynthesis protein FlgD [Phycisphaerales bacterium]